MYFYLLYHKRENKSMRSIVFVIRGEATPILLPITSYLLLPKNPVKNFG